MRNEKFQPIPQKYKGSQKTNMNNYMPKKGLPKKNGQFQKRYNFPRLNHGETENEDRQITSDEIESVIKTLQTNKSLRLDGFIYYGH